GFYVDKLQRVAFANLTFHNLRVGDARELGQLELNELRDLVGLDHSVTARGKWRSTREDTDIPRRARAKAIAEAEEAADEAAARGGGGDDDREDTWDWQGGGEGDTSERGESRDRGAPRGGPGRGETGRGGEGRGPGGRGGEARGAGARGES